MLMSNFDARNDVRDWEKIKAFTEEFTNLL